uniref:proline-rich protein 36 n=1 Tax=Semicossyphus pulcher TaxID=241346 RepID=UPI0037E8DAE2
MKRGPLHIFGRKNHSLFDTNVKMKDMDARDVELVLESSAIPESGTASVRARPTVKHHTSSHDSFQGFAVPTPKVPLLPPVNGPKINGSVGGDQLSNGSLISGPDLAEEDIFVPPHPSMAPPPPPGTSILPPGTFIPPPDFMGDLSTLDLATLQPSSMPAPNPTSLAPSREEEDLTFLKPPPMAPPKPPSTCSSGSASSVPISSPPLAQVPNHPRFAPPQPPAERQNKSLKTPPTKPVRLSSISNFDSPPQNPAPPPPVQTPTLSTFNPQHTAKLYNVPTTSLLKSYEEPDTRPKQKLLLEDSEPVKTAPAPVQVDGKAPKVATPPKPVSKDVQELKDSLKITQTPQATLPVPNKEAKAATVSAPQIEKPLRNSRQTSPQLQKDSSASVNTEPNKDKIQVSPNQSHKFSPLLDRKLRNLKSSESNGAREGHAASPLALLMAAKKREKHRTNSLSRENSAKKDEQPSTSVHPSNSIPNSVISTPRSSSSSSLASQERVQESPKSVSPAEHAQTIQTPEKSSSPALVKGQMPSSSPGLSRTAGSPSVTNLVARKQNTDQSLSKSQSPQPEDLSVPFLPPPPEFDDFDDIVGPPPSIPPPDPPRKVAPPPTLTPLPPFQAPSPPPPPKPKPPAPPKLPPPNIDIKPKLQVPTKPKVVPNQLPSNLSASQATLLSILQKKMAEMDHKMTSVKEAESSSDDWGSPLSDEDNKVPVVPKATRQIKNTPVVNKPPALDMRELEGKVVKKYQENSSVKSPTSNGVQSKHQYGMTFTVRPGTKNPITLFGQGEP